MIEMFAAVAEANRFRIVELLLSGPRTVNDIGERLQFLTRREIQFGGSKVSTMSPNMCSPCLRTKLYCHLVGVKSRSFKRI